MKLGVVDVGGGLRGIYAVGVLDYCMDHQIHFDLGIGVSAESANLACQLDSFTVLIVSGCVLDARFCPAYQNLTRESVKESKLITVIDLSGIGVVIAPVLSAEVEHCSVSKEITSHIIVSGSAEVVHKLLVLSTGDLCDFAA